MEMSEKVFFLSFLWDHPCLCLPPFLETSYRATSAPRPSPLTAVDDEEEGRRVATGGREDKGAEGAAAEAGTHEESGEERQRRALTAPRARAGCLVGGGGHVGSVKGARAGGGALAFR
jgi:hypothetical protein